jgi:hypothetical protein
VVGKRGTSEANPSEAFLSGYNAGRHGGGAYDVNAAWATYLQHGGTRHASALREVTPIAEAVSDAEIPTLKRLTDSLLKRLPFESPEGLPGKVHYYMVQAFEAGFAARQRRASAVKTPGNADKPMGTKGGEDLGSAVRALDAFKPVIAAAREVAHEVDIMFSGGGDGGLEKCHECDLGPIGHLRDAMYKLRPLLAALPSTEGSEHIVREESTEREVTHGAPGESLNCGETAASPTPGKSHVYLKPDEPAPAPTEVGRSGGAFGIEAGAACATSAYEAGECRHRLPYEKCVAKDCREDYAAWASARSSSKADDEGDEDPSAPRDPAADAFVKTHSVMANRSQDARWFGYQDLVVAFQNVRREVIEECVRHAEDVESHQRYRAARLREEPSVDPDASETEAELCDALAQGAKLAANRIKARMAALLASEGRKS